jgi:hypothetical protein
MDTIIQFPDNKLFRLAHNISYDICFIFSYLDNLYNNFIIRGKLVLRLEGLNHGKNIIFKDNNAIIPKALRYFPNIFEFPEIKEIYLYRYYDLMMNKGEFFNGNRMDGFT